MDDIMKIVKSLEDSGLLTKGVSETVKNEAKEQSGGFLSLLLGTLGASLLEHLLTGNGVKRSKTLVTRGNILGRGVIGGKEIEQARILNAALSFDEFWKKYYQNETKFNGVYSRNNLTLLSLGVGVVRGYLCLWQI